MEVNGAIENTKAGRLALPVLASVLLFLLLIVTFPLTIKTSREGGGLWGFGIVGLHFLLPLNFYFLFAIAAWLKNKTMQRRLFIAAHIVTIILGFIAFAMFPVLPKLVLIVPVALAVVGISDRKRLAFYLMLMISLAIVANILLLKWELDFGRSIPIIQLLQSTLDVDP